jgi:hypothetical protein
MRWGQIHNTGGVTLVRSSELAGVPDYISSNSTCCFELLRWIRFGLHQMRSNDSRGYSHAVANVLVATPCVCL